MPLHLVSMICVKSLEWSSTRNDCVLLTEDFFYFHQCWNNNVYNNHQLKKNWSNQCWNKYLYQKHSIHFKTIVFRSYPNLILFCMLCNKIIKPFLSFIVSMETLILWGNNFKRKFFKKLFFKTWWTNKLQPGKSDQFFCSFTCDKFSICYT